mgnify:FL=1
MKFVKITKKQQSDFDRDGLLVVKNVLDSDTIKKVTKLFDANKKSQPPPKNYYSNSFVSLTPESEILTKLICNNTIVSLMVQLMSPEIIAGPGMGAIYKPPQKQLDGPLNKKKGFSHPFVHPEYPAQWNWHRDLNNWLPNDPRRGTCGINVFFCLTDAVEENSGSTLLIPGSYKYTKQITINKKTGYPNDHYIEPSVKAGDVYFFSQSTYHAVGPNFSNSTMKLAIVGYKYLWMNYINFADDKKVKPQLANAKAGLESMLKNYSPEELQCLGHVKREGWLPNLPLRLWGKENGLDCDELPMRFYG